MNPHVLILAPGSDEHARVVAKRVEQLGATAVIMDTVAFPTQWRLSVGISNSSASTFLLEHGGIRLNVGNLAGVWWRRPRPHLGSTAIEESHLRQFAEAEAREAFQGWLLGLKERVINSPVAEASARKIRQLELAAALNLLIPETLITNSPEAAQKFLKADHHRFVYKPFTPPNWCLIPTQRVCQDAVDHLAAVAHAPVIFQREVPKVADIRVTIVDDQLFATRIRSTHDEPCIDWRAEADCEYADHELPTEVASGLVELMKRLGLRFAACDLGLLEDGRHVFFEANPGGQWLIAEIMLGHPISIALARALLSGPPVLEH